MRPALLTALALALAAPAAADHGQAHHDHGAGHGSAATLAYREANAKMHAAMDIPFTDDADVDFVRGMIAHHEGAIDMARVVIEHGADPEVKALAEGIIAAQDKEIAWMQGWLAKKGQ